MHLPVSKGNQKVDLWLDQGTHDLSIFAATDSSSKGVEATIARATLNTGQLRLAPFAADDFDLSTAPQVTPPTAAPAPQPIIFSAAKAVLKKETEEFGSGAAEEQPQLDNWKSPEDVATWSVDVPQPGAYEVWINCAHSGTGSKATVQVGKQTLVVDIPDTKGWDQYQDALVGKIIIDEPGEISLNVTPAVIAAGNLMNLKNVSFKTATDSTTLVNGPQWDFRFPTQDLRYVRFVFNEFLGESVAVNHVEIGGPSSAEPYIPTREDVLALASNNTLEIAAGDTVTANYTDEFTQNSSGTSQLLNAKLTATYNNASITPITYAFTRSTGGQVQETRLNLMRVDAGDRIIVEITDYDEDTTSEQDEIEFEVFVNDAEPLRLKATETDPYSGIFTKEVDTTANEEKGKLTVAPGDRVYIRYLDLQNTFPGHSVPRESVVFVSKPTDAKLSILQTRTVARKEGDLRAARVKVTDPPVGPEDSLVSLNAPLTIEVIDPDRAKNSASTVKVAVLTTGGSALVVECGISNAYQTGVRRNTKDALEQGRFLGQVVLQLGGDGSPELVPRTVSMPRNLIGEVQSIDPEAEETYSDMVIRVLNLTGKDSITAAYNDKQRIDSATARLTDTARLVSDGTLSITEREYVNPVESLHVGEKIYFSVNDADQDTSDDRDSLTLQVTTALGDAESVELYETLTHSGIFTGSFLLKASQEPITGNLDPQNPAIECYFGDTITASYRDQSAASQLETLEVTQQVPVVIGTDGLVTAFTKTFNDETLAVETKFRIAESYFELFKSHKQLERTEEQETDLQAGRRVLREVMEDYPDPKYAPRISYLLGQFAQELEDWDEAIRSYELIIRRFPDHTLSADARYKLAQSYEEAGEFDDALEAYVTLAATHPKSPLIASVMIRISDYFYRNEDFEIAAQVGEKFGQRFEGHDHASKMAFRVGQCYYKTEDYKLAGFSFDEFAKQFPEDELSADSLFWSGEAYRLGNNNREAFRRYNRCRWDYPESEAAKYARGRLALPEMLQQFEAEASSIDNE
jgi:TolA-binding protein